jgi:GrpB-like predicted nucleotidyltransferase (UPF0157 family)
MAPIEVHPYDPSWPACKSHTVSYASGANTPEDFALIAHQLSTLLNSATPPIEHKIHHVGSTSIRRLVAKPHIDIAIVVPTAHHANLASDALLWTDDPRQHHIPIGDGGIRGRISMKFNDWRRLPRRNVYIIAKDCEEGMLGLRGYLDLKRVLSEDEELRREYEEVKFGLVQSGAMRTVEYGKGKNEVIAKILRVAGWSDVEVRMKENLDTREGDLPLEDRY